MKYKLLSYGRGVPLTLMAEPAVPLALTFENAPPGAKLYLHTQSGAIFYHEIGKNGCAVNLAGMSGDVRIGVVTETEGRWECGFLRVYQSGRGIFAAPSAADLAEQVRELALQNDSLAAENAELKRHMEELEKKFQDFYEGYDFL
jgi:hypothetical protein